MKALRITGGTILALTLLASSASAEVRWVMAGGHSEDNFGTKAIRSFIADVEKTTNGQIKIDLRANGELIKLESIRRAVQAGQVQLGEIRFGVYGNESAMYTLDSMPNLAGNYEAAERLMEAQKPWFDETLGKHGIQALSYLTWPGQGIYSNFEAGDGSPFKGVTIRVHSALTQKMAELLGFQATILPFAEVPQAFATGLIKSLFTSAQTGVDIQVWDYAKYYTYTGTMHTKNAIVINKKALDSLTPELRDAVTAAGERATQAAFSLSKQASAETMQKLKDHGIDVGEASPELEARMDEVGKTLLEEWRKTATPEENAVLDNYLASRP